MNRTLRSKIELGNQDRLLKNISLTKTWLKNTNHALSQLKNLISMAKKMATEMRDKSSKHADPQQMIKDLERLFAEIDKIVSSQNMRKESSAWNHTVTSSFRKEEGEAVYRGETEEIELAIDPGLNIKINSIESNFLTKSRKTLGEDVDLKPAIDQNTRLSDLNLGRGINLGLIKVANDITGVSWDINLHHAITLEDVIDAIDASQIASLSARINASRRGLELSYACSNNPNPGQELTISEADGTTASDLGILTGPSEDSDRGAGSMAGKDLNPILTEKTPISLLKGGRGLMLGSIKIILGETQRIVDLSSACTIGEIIDAINNSMPEVIASVNNSKRGISLESTVEGKSLVVYDADDKKTARSLEISGSPDMWGAFQFLIESLNNGDHEASSKSLGILDLGSEEISSLMAETEAKLKRLENIESRLRDLQPEMPRLLSQVNRDDVSRATTGLANQQCIFQAALKRGAAMLQPTLLDFIR